VDRAANRSPRLSETHQPQPQHNQRTSQFTLPDSVENSAQSNNSNQSSAPRMTQPVSTHNTMSSLANSHFNKLDQESVDLHEFSELKISSYSSSQSNQPPSTNIQLTKEIFSQIWSAQSKSDLENCMRIVGVSTLQEL
jgi:hypothetical protein